MSYDCDGSQEATPENIYKLSTRMDYYRVSLVSEFDSLEEAEAAFADLEEHVRGVVTKYELTQHNDHVNRVANRRAKYAVQKDNAS